MFSRLIFPVTKYHTFEFYKIIRHKKFLTVNKQEKKKNLNSFARYCNFNDKINIFENQIFARYKIHRNYFRFIKKAINVNPKNIPYVFGYGCIRFYMANIQLYYDSDILIYPEFREQ